MRSRRLKCSAGKHVSSYFPCLFLQPEHSLVNVSSTNFLIGSMPLVCVGMKQLLWLVTDLRSTLSAGWLVVQPRQRKRSSVIADLEATIKNAVLKILINHIYIPELEFCI